VAADSRPIDTSGKPIQQDEEVSYWLTEIERSRRAMQSWENRCKNIRKIYRDDMSVSRRKRRYAMLWSNLETLGPAIYAKAPQPVVQRRYKDADRAGRAASEILERAIEFTFDANDFDSRLKQVRDDYMLYGRGVARIFYEPIMETVTGPDQESGLDVESMEGPQKEGQEVAEEAVEAGEPQEVLNFEHVRVGFVQRSDFVHQKARVWEEVDWIAFRGYLDREGLIKRFGSKIGKKIAIESYEEREHSYEDAPPGGDKAEIWEIWDKAKQKVLWISKSYEKVLEKGNPYLKLEGFYPCPKPAYGTLTPDSLEPVPDYIFYQDQVEEIDRLTTRISALTDALKLVGFYPGGPQGEGSPEVERAMTPGFENKLIAVKSWAAFKMSGGDGAPIVWLPIENVVNILETCINLRKQLVDDVYQIFGLSDIMRGQETVAETATAQTIKAQFGSLRIDERKREIARFARDITRMTAEIIATTFQPETLEKMTNIKLPSQADIRMLQAQAALQGSLASTGGMPASPAPGGESTPPTPPAPDSGPSQEDVFGILRDNVLRRFLIDIEVDSTIAGNETQDRQDRNQFIATTTQFIETWMPLVAQLPDLAPLAGGLLLFGVRAYRAGRELEELIEETVDKLEQRAMNPPQPQASPDEMIKAQTAKIKGQAEIQKSGIDLQKANLEGRLKLGTAIAKAQTDAVKAHHDQQKTAMEMARDAMRHEQELIQTQLGVNAPNAAPNIQQ
jgi:hypothetical protein